MHAAHLSTSQHAKRLFGRFFEIAGSCLKRATIGVTDVSQIRCPLFFNGRWSDPGVPFGPWRAMVEKCAYRAFGGFLSSPITTARFLAPLPPYPTTHLPQSPATPSLSSRSQTKPCKFSFYEMHHIQCHQRWTNVHP